MTLIVGILLAIFINREITQLRLRKKTTAMKAKKNTKPRSNNWVAGIVYTYDDKFDFEVKVYDEPSGFGIATASFTEGGNVSKLGVSDSAGYAIFYDRGWGDRTRG